MLVNYLCTVLVCVLKDCAVKFLQTSLWNNLHPNQVVGTAAVIKEIDCLTVTVIDILNVRASISSSITTEETRLCGFAGWFDVHFRVS